MVDIEDLTELELDVLHKYYATLSEKAEADDDIHKSHSIDQANRQAADQRLSQQKSTDHTIHKS